jgi:hypothetical protein
VRILALIGVPGTGKTFLMRRLIQALGGIRATDRDGLCNFHLVGEADAEVMVLGKYEEGDIFGGTDKLSMAAQADAESLVKEALSEGVKALTFEGDRLGNESFFEHCSKVGELRVVVIKIEPELLRQRRENRSFEVGKEQNATWLQGRETKVSNLEKTFRAQVFNIDTPQQVEETIAHFEEWLLGNVTVEIPQRSTMGKLF